MDMSFGAKTIRLHEKEARDFFDSGFVFLSELGSGERATSGIVVEYGSEQFAGGSQGVKNTASVVFAQPASCSCQE